MSEPVIKSYDSGREGIVVQLGRLYLGLVVSRRDELRRAESVKIEAVQFFNTAEQAQAACDKKGNQ